MYYKKEGNIEKAIEYLSMAIRNGNEYSLKYIMRYPEIIKQIVTKQLEYKEQISEMTEYITELEYVPNGVGYEKAKEHFEEIHKKYGF